MKVPLRLRLIWLQLLVIAMFANLGMVSAYDVTDWQFWVSGLIGFPCCTINIVFEYPRLRRDWIARYGDRG